MDQTPLFIVNAFTNGSFSGNPAAVCIRESWLSDELMQKIAMQNNLSETAFLVPTAEGYTIRWFTPAVEVDLCGHATLASAFTLFTEFDVQDSITFFSPRSGQLSAKREEDLIYLNFPIDEFHQTYEEDFFEEALGIRPVETYRGKTDMVAVLSSEQEVRELQPNISKILSLPGRGIIITAPGEMVDFVSRFFAPQSGVDEDPVTGSAHTTLTPLWASKLGKDSMHARQLSNRGGSIHCFLKGERCHLGGMAELYLKGNMLLPSS